MKESVLNTAEKCSKMKSSSKLYGIGDLLEALFPQSRNKQKCTNPPPPPPKKKMYLPKFGLVKSWKVRLLREGFCFLLRR